jgi:hypothetical protein
MGCAVLNNKHVQHLLGCLCLGATFAASAADDGNAHLQREVLEPQRIERVMPAGGSTVPVRRFDGDAPPAVRHTGFADQRRHNLTPDERRQLRRDIREAAKELYRDSPER